ncbi:MAG: hypothetical protein R3E96_09690 [Planctomycetota bacterium]
MARFFRSPTWHRALVVLDQGLLSGFSFVTTLVLLREHGARRLWHLRVDDAGVVVGVRTGQAWSRNRCRR